MLENFVTYILVGILSGFMAGFFGLGGGIFITVGLTIFLNFSPQRAIGTSLAAMLPPIGLMAVLEYNRVGAVDFKAAIIIAISMIITAYIGAMYASRMNADLLKIYFGALLVSLGSYIIINTWSKL